MVNSDYHHEPASQEEVKKLADDKLFNRVMCKDASMANSSCRVYYGSSGAIPFVWESQPGTPKHILAGYDSSNLPPLTPPPSYYSTSMPKSKRYGGKNKSNFFVKPNFLRALTFPAMKINHSPSFSMSSTNSSSSSSSSSSILSSPSLSRSKNFQKLRCFSLPVRCQTYDEDKDEAENENTRRRRRCYSIGSIKSAILSIVGHGSRSNKLIYS